MKVLLYCIVALVAGGAMSATTVHRSFRNGYPAYGGVTVRTQPNAAVLKAPKGASRTKNTVVTNRVVLTKEQAEKLLKSKKLKKTSTKRLSE